MHIRAGDVDFLKLSELVCSLFGCRMKKTIYYNSVPDIRDGKDMYYSHVKFLGGIAKLPRFEVRTRKLQKHSTLEIREEKMNMLKLLDLCGKCRAVVESACMECVGGFKKKEKGIDVMIAVDMLEHAIRDQCDACILISGDADFVPALKLVEKSGKKAFSAFMPKGYSFELRDKFAFRVLGRDTLTEKCLK
jgi:uncharacterized LabA/DUF88 family protein